MGSVLDKTKVEMGAVIRSDCAAACCGYNVQEVAAWIEKGVDDAFSCLAIAFAAGSALAFLGPRPVKKVKNPGF